MNPLYEIQCRFLDHKNEVYLSTSEANASESKDSIVRQALNLMEEYQSRPHDEVLAVIETDLTTGNVKTIYNKAQLADLLDERIEDGLKAAFENERYGRESDGSAFDMSGNIFVGAQ